jgi:hypothetical protein
MLLMAFDGNEEKMFMRFLWKVLLGVVTLVGQIVFKYNGESCAMIVAEKRNLTRIDKWRILEEAMEFLF